MLTPLVCLSTLCNPTADGLAAPYRVKDAAGYIDVNSGHAAPLVTDFDGDGLADLLVGQFGDGKLRIYKNAGTVKEPKFQGFTWFKTGEQDARIPSG